MSNPAKVLFVDYDENIVNTLRLLCKNKFTVFTATSGSKALELLQTNQIHIVVAGQRTPDIAGIDLLRAAAKASPRTIRILLTGYADLAAIIGSIHEGEIYRYIYKPWNNKDVFQALEAAAQLAIVSHDAVSATPAAHAAETTHAAPGILVIDADQDAYQAISRLFAERHVWTVANCDEALAMLARERIGVVVTSVIVGQQDVTPFIKTLKDQYPDVVTVIMTKGDEANRVVGLVNGGQVFRFLGKPLHHAQLRVSIEAALVYHAKSSQQPKLLSRQEPEPTDAAASSRFTSLFLSRRRPRRATTNTRADR